jgi:hypothetical protein
VIDRTYWYDEESGGDDDSWEWDEYDEDDQDAKVTDEELRGNARCVTLKIRGRGALNVKGG